MPREFKLPDVGEGVHEGELVEWLVEPGDEVTEDTPVAKVETDKALVDVPAPVNGTVRELRWEPGDVVPVGETLLVFDVEGEVDEADLEVEPEPADGNGGGGQTGGGEPAHGTEAGGGASPEAESGTDTAPPEPTASGDSRSDSRLFAPPSARRLARELGVDIAAVEGSGPGGRVSEEDVRAAADASEPAAESEPSASGPGEAEPSETATQPATPEGGAGAPVGGGPDQPDAAGTGAASAGEAADRDRTLAAPATRRVAEEEGVDIDAVPAVEERDGEAFVTEAAVREYAEAQRRAQAADAEAVSSGAALGGAAGGTGSATGAAAGTAAEPGEKPVEREAYRGVRRRIGEAMTESKYTAPHVSHHDEADATRLVEAKERLADRAGEQGIRLTYMPFVLKAVTGALKEYPIMNTSLDEDAEEIVYKRYYDLGVATATDAGLMVPVVEGIDRKGLLQIASELNEVVERARERTISPEELRGSTFTVTNVGAIGGEYATPILNYPEVGILALGQIRRKPRVVVDEETGVVRPSGARPGSGDERSESAGESIEPRSILPLSLSIDHRVVDGAIAARFTNAVIERLEQPELLLLE